MNQTARKHIRSIVLNVVGVPRVSGLCLLATLLLIGASWRDAMGQGSREDYARSKSYEQRTRGLVYRDSIRPH